MILLVFFSFLAGLVTILSPCILPILPVVLAGSVGDGRRKPMGIVTGFVASFTFFTLFLTSIVKATGIPADYLRLLSVITIFVFGLSLVLPGFQAAVEKFFTRLPHFSSTGKNGFFGGFVIGLGLGLLWSPCVGPILASVISLALVGSVNLSAVLITLAFSLGTAIPMFVIIYTGRTVLGRLQPYATAIQKSFGLLMIITALGIYFNLDRKFQTFILNAFPGYGAGLTRLEDNSLVRRQLDKLKSQPMDITAPQLIPGGQWFNLPAGRQVPRILDLRGKVVLVDFWTYTCINCIRTLPYLTAWDAKYRDRGLVIIGVHTPEFEFEKNPANVARAIADFGIKYPVMQDNDYATWRAFANRYWPAKYLIDQGGRIVYTHFGEGDYDETEKRIQELLALDLPMSNPAYQITARTPELYLGDDRRTPGYFTFSGPWQYSPEFAAPEKGTTLALNFEAKDVFLVMRPVSGPGRVQIYLDDKLLSTITVDSDKLYELIRLPQPGRHRLKLEFLDSNLELYAFTFG